MTTFTELVRELVATTPPGKVLTYGRLAAFAGSPKAAMSAGNALGAPGELDGWHRVVRSDGRLAFVHQAELLRAEVDSDDEAFRRVASSDDVTEAPQAAKAVGRTSSGELSSPRVRFS